MNDEEDNNDDPIASFVPPDEADRLKSMCLHTIKAAPEKILSSRALGLGIEKLSDEERQNLWSDGKMAQVAEALEILSTCDSRRI